MHRIALDFAILILGNVITMAIAIAAWYRNPGSRGCRAFFVTCSVAVFWSIVNYYTLQPNSLELAILATHWSYVAGIWVIAALLYFSYLFPIEHLHGRLFKIGLAGLVAASSWFAYSHLVVQRVLYSAGRFDIVPGPAYPLYGLLLLVMGALIFVAFRQNYRIANLVERNQIRYIAFGIGLTLAVGILFNVILVLVNPIFGSALGNMLPTLVAVAFIGYGLIRHRFMDVHLLIAQAITYLGCLGIMFVLILGISRSLSLAFPDSPNISIFSLIGTASLLVLLFQPIRKRIQLLTDKIFNPSWYDKQILLTTLGSMIASELHLDYLLTNSLDYLCSQLGVTHGQVCLLQADDELETVKQFGKSPKRLIAASALMRLDQSKIITLTDELSDTNPLRQQLERHNIRVTVRLKTRGQFVGFLLLGTKKTGDIFSNKDVGVLQILANQLAVAIVSAQSYEQINRFNQTLQTRVNRATASLSKAHEKLKADDRMKTEFTMLTSHNLRTPLTIVNGTADLLADSSLSSHQRHLLTNLQTASDRLSQLVEDLLTISSIESGNQLVLQSVKATDVLLPLVAEARELSTAKGIALKLDLKLDNINLQANLPRLQGAIRNLLDNAFKFTPKGYVEITAAATRKELIIKIADTGIGIAESELPTLFNKFHRTTSVLEYNYEGEGIGLFLTNLIVAEHNGKVRVQSHLGHGSTFSIILPANPK